MAIENKKYFASKLVKIKISWSTDIFLRAFLLYTIFNELCISGKLSLTASNTLEITLTLHLSIALCGYVSCWCTLDLNLKYLNDFIFLWLATPWLIRLLNIVMKRWDWLLNAVTRFFPWTILQSLSFFLWLSCSCWVFSFD